MLKLLATPLSSILAISACILFILPQNTFANTQNSGIEVRGQAIVLAEPDVFSLSIAIIEKGYFTDKIRSIVDHKSNQVVDVAKKLGIESGNINSARVSLRVIKDELGLNAQGLEVNHKLPNNQNSKVMVRTSSNNETSGRPQYFELSRNITINFSDLTDYDKFLNAILKIGVNQISPLSMSVGDTDKYYKQALSLAMTKAKEKAEQIAKQTEQDLGKVIYIQETSSNYYRAAYSSSMRKTTAFEHNSQVGNQEINASVLVKYSIE
jgi:uncharacterized protein YggE